MKLKTTTYLCAVSLLVAVVVRLALLVTYRPLYSNDSPSYAALAHMIQAGSFEDYDGRRTPGYPLFMWLLHFNNQWIRFAQYLCGLLSILLIYVLARQAVPRSQAWVLLMFMGISIQFPFYESMIQTEAPAMLVMLGSLYFFVAPASRPRCNLAMAGVLAASGALIRPHLVILPPIYLAIYALQNRRNVRQRLGGLLVLALPAVLLVGGWILFNYNMLSRATFTTLPRADIIAHMIHYLPDADEKFGQVKEAYIEAYAAMKDKVEASDDNRCWYTTYAGQLLRQRGFAINLALGDTIHDMAMDLIKKHPFGYLKNVVYAWLRFWRVHIIVYEECFAPNAGLYRAVMWLWLPIKVLWLVVNGLFLAFLPIWPFLSMSSRRRFLLVTLYGLVLAASLSQALTQYFDNARFAVPFQPLVAIAVAMVGATLFERFGKSGAGGALPDQNPQ